MAKALPPFLTSRLLSGAGIVHGFTVRDGGVSQGHLASLNLSHAVGDEPSAVEENLARLRDAADLEGLARVHQVHGDRVMGARGPAGAPELIELLAPSEPHAAKVSGERAEARQPRESADALVALEPGVAVAVAVADCVPLLLGAPGLRAVAAVHSGWRGARLSIAARGVRALQHSSGADPAQMIAAIGPCIGRCCYEVSAELAASFRALFGPEAADDPEVRPAPHLDLRYCVESALRAAGVPAAHIEQVEGCTSCDARAFFSHRRDRGRTGRHLAFAVA